jgi:hypothetical protein
MSNTIEPKSFTDYTSTLDDFVNKGEVSKDNAGFATHDLLSLSHDLHDPNVSSHSFEQAAGSVINADKKIEEDLKNAGDTKGAEKVAHELKNVLADVANKAGESHERFTQNANQDAFIQGNMHGPDDRPGSSGTFNPG